MKQVYDIAIVGAGMAGASLAAEIGRASAGATSVVVLEAEERPGYHSTGRSAAFWEECYGGPELVPLTLASGIYLREHGFLTQRGALYLGREEDRAALDAFMDRFADTGATIHRLGRAALAEHIPGVRPEWTGAVWEPACADIDVAGLHQHYLAMARKAGVDLVTRARLAEARSTPDRWELKLESGAELSASILVDAAGAWADPVATMAGVKPLGIQPYRRTVAQLRVDPAAPGDLPLCLDISGRFYFKPEGGSVWLSPHDETPTPAVDAAAEEIDVATAIDRFEKVVDWQVRAVEHKWAGLRSFAPDRLPVYGFDPANPRFFWFAGQGGYGIQTAPAAARLASQLILGTDRDELTSGLDAALYAPDRVA